MRNVLSRLIPAILFSLSGLHGRDESAACTTVVVSGKVTPDGRPLMWKNRDTWQCQNEIVYDTSGTFTFIGVANAEATQRIRMGVNTAGLCIQNSVSRDLAPSLTTGLDNGEFICEALKTCRSIHDVAQLLDKTNAIGRRTRSNFGVIDADGGAAMIEAGPNSYRIFDANDPTVAPEGFIVRSNFSETGTAVDLEDVDQADSTGAVQRYRRSHELCLQAKRSQNLNARFLLSTLCRDIGEYQTRPHGDSVETSAIDTPSVYPERIPTVSTINRDNTVSAVVFRGAAKGESPRLATMWAILGQPLFSVAIPCWAEQGQIAESVNGKGASELCSLAVELMTQHYDEQRRLLWTPELSNLIEDLAKVENDIFIDVEKSLQNWVVKEVESKDLYQKHCISVEKATKELRTLLSKSLSDAKTAQQVQAISINPAAIDFTFDDPDESPLTKVIDHTGTSQWNVSLQNSDVKDGKFSIRRNRLSPVTAYAKIEPYIKPGELEGVDKGFLVVEVDGWNLTGKTLCEEVRMGFTSRLKSSFHTATFSLTRTGDDEVTLRGIAFGTGSTNIDNKATFPAKQSVPITFVLELDKVDGNPDEGDSGGRYRVHYRAHDDEDYTQLGDGGFVRRRRNGNYIHLRCVGLFAAKGEYFNIGRIYYTTFSPLNP